VPLKAVGARRIAVVLVKFDLDWVQKLVENERGLFRVSLLLTEFSAPTTLSVEMSDRSG
jgi:hypothetical protein